MEIYLQSLDFDIWLSTENRIKDSEFNEQPKEEILKGLSKLDLEKVIYYETTKEIWNELQSVYDEETQVAYDIKRPSLKNGSEKIQRVLKIIN